MISIGPNGSSIVGDHVSRYLATFIVCTAVFGSGLSRAQVATSAARDAVSPETQRLFKRWVDVCEAPRDGNTEGDPVHGPELEQFIVRPDADLCLARFLIESRGHGAASWAAAQELGKLSTKRSFDLIATRLKSKDMFVREEAVQILNGFTGCAECVPLLVDVLEHDPEGQVRRQAALALRSFRDTRSEAALIHAVEKDEKWVADAASSALGEMNSRAAIDPVIKRLRSASNEQEVAETIESVRDYRRKAVIEAVLEAYASVKQPPLIQYGHLRFAEGWAGRVQMAAATVMKGCFRAVNNLNGPQPDDYVEEWQDWWKQVEPLLTDDLEAAVGKAKARACNYFCVSRAGNVIC